MECCCGFWTLLKSYMEDMGFLKVQPKGPVKCWFVEFHLMKTIAYYSYIYHVDPADTGVMFTNWAS